uniref:Secreted phosphoprotein 24 n=1 Tax=Capra hircus TaxID=9925 RepID=A0A8C2S087_CAPHI
MEKMVMKMLVIFVLGMNHWTCTGFPVYDYDPASLKEALSASVAKVNSQSLSPYLFRAFRSSIKRVNALDEDSLTMDLEFRIQETTCRRESEADPATCDFQRGYHVPVAICRSTVRMSSERVQNVWVRCHWSSSSGSSSSEEWLHEEFSCTLFPIEPIWGLHRKKTPRFDLNTVYQQVQMFFGDILGSSTSRNSHLLGRFFTAEPSGKQKPFLPINKIGLTPDRSRGEPLYERSRARCIGRNRSSSEERYLMDCVIFF